MAMVRFSCFSRWANCPSNSASEEPILRARVKRLPGWSAGTPTAWTEGDCIGLILECGLAPARHPLAKLFVNSVHPSRCHVVIPCAGTGSRAGGVGPKQYQTIAGKPMVWHTLHAFAHTPRIHDVLVVVAPGDTQMQALLQVHASDWAGTSIRAAQVGGDSRAASVLAGLRELLQSGASEDDWVLVHDAARCLIRPAFINELIDACQHDAVGGLLAMPLPDTLKTAEHARVIGTVERGDKWLAQTPQMFRLGALLHALMIEEHQQFVGITDEASAMERQGLSPRLVQPSGHNFKVTYPQDFLLAEAVMAMRQQEPA